MSDLPFALRYQRPEVFADWLAEGLEGATLHGSYLAHLLGGRSWCGKYKAGLPDNAYAADELLKAAEGLGWIVKGEFRPDHSQAAFAGLQHRGGAYSYPREHVWKVNRHSLDAFRFACSRAGTRALDKRPAHG